MDFNMVGPALSLAFSAIGSSIGVGIAGMTSHGVMSRVEEGHGKMIAITAMPSSQLIYGFVLMLLLKNAVVAGSVAPLSAVFVGGGAGIAIMVAAIYQGLCCATAIEATAKQPKVFGKAFIAITLIESFALFVFVFSLLLIT